MRETERTRTSRVGETISCIDGKMGKETRRGARGCRGWLLGKQPLGRNETRQQGGFLGEKEVGKQSCRGEKKKD